MNNVIYWTCREIAANSFAALALCPRPSGVCFCYTSNSEYSYELFTSIEEVTMHVTELYKPKYYRDFSANYELRYLDWESEEWASVFSVWISFYEMMEKLRHEANLPLHKKAFLGVKKVWRRIAGNSGLDLPSDHTDNAII